MLTEKNKLGMLLFFVPALLLLQGAHWVGFLLDDLFFRGYRNITVRDPLFVVGLPRSGTSFLQRVLAQDSERFTTLRLWELILAPSVTERMLARRWGRDRMSAYSRANESIAARAADYDRNADGGEIKPIYRFGEGVVEGEDLTITDREIRVPGFGKSVNLVLENPWSDLSGD